MSTRSTPVLREIVDVLFTELDEQATALDRLEHHFQHRLLMDVGNVTAVGGYAEQLRLRITADERSTVLDYIAERKMVVITIDIVEMAINELFVDRFIEP
jgi:excinuclease UvrABC helicase subunit UvrB